MGARLPSFDPRTNSVWEGASGRNQNPGGGMTLVLRSAYELLNGAGLGSPALFPFRC